MTTFASDTQAANVDATLSRFKHQQAMERRKEEAAAALAVATNERPVKQDLDPDFNPERLDVRQPADAEDEGQASGAAQLADQMSQVGL